MNGETLQRIVEEIVSRLQRRVQSTATLSVTQLRDADCPALFCQHASLRILLVDLPLLGQLADAETDDAADRKIHDALAFGIRVQLSLHSQLLPVIPVKKLARLPLVFTDEHGLPLVLHAGSVLSYRDVALLSRGRVVVHRKCIVTAMARDAANARNIQLIKQE
ncbi:propanediol utilization microcompartment protein PduM [Salmonella enterica]|nr:propanediol utilization microcompartment protein PduM [Salmonella enterica]EKI6061275.1 propanediol utilization microcompartment protein PduM [Salmonella enterica]EKI6440962.1 propanediol utilization microcompartment protein PduM [Salmonella enterica]